MSVVRVLGFVGRAFISLGVFTLLFAAYQLWGTGVLEARAQNSLESEFESLLAEAGVPEPTGAIRTDPAEIPDEATGAEPVDNRDERFQSLGQPRTAAEPRLDPSFIWRDRGDSIALLSIDKIGLAKYVVEGVGVEELRDGPGHYPSTPMPGMPGNASIAGHRTTWGAPFHRIDELDPGDPIFVRTVQGTFEYRVLEQPNGKGHFIVSPDRVDVLDQDFESHPNRLTLTACHPKLSAAQRIIVVAELIGEPAAFVPRPDADADPDDGPSLASEDLPGDPDLPTEEPTEEPTAEPEATEEPAPTPDGEDGADPAGDREAPQAIAVDRGAGSSGGGSPGAGATESLLDDSFGEGLGGDQGAILPAVLWAIAVAALWSASNFIAKRWRRLPTYALAIVPFSIVLFICYMHIDRALPSY